MKAITLHQPWATLIAIGAKAIETRPSPPHGPMCPEGIRGYPGLPIDRGERIAIHAAASKPPCTQWEDAPYDDLGDRWQYGRHAEGSREWWLADLDPRTPDSLVGLPLGAIVATAVVTDAAPMVDERGWWADTDTPEPPFIDLTLDALYWGPDYWGEAQETDLGPELDLGHYEHTRWGWLLTDVEPLATPLPVKGRQGVWSLSFEDAFALEVSRG